MLKIFGSFYQIYFDPTKHMFLDFGASTKYLVKLTKLFQQKFWSTLADKFAQLKENLFYPTEMYF